MNTIIDGGQSGYTCVLAHGAGAPMDSEFMTFFAKGLAAKGIQVVRFEFPYMQERRLNGKKRPPDRQPILLASYAELLKTIKGPVVIAGKSMGGRMASVLASEGVAAEQVKGVLALGYPFHPVGKPEKSRTDHFPLINVPMSIMQGTRDKLGDSSWVADARIPNSIDINWFEDGDHDLKPRVKSGMTHQQHLQGAIDKSAQFIRKCLDAVN